MKEQQLINNGFRKEVLDKYYWYEIKIGNHLFLTNDTLNNSGKDQWFIGYQNQEDNTDTFWFNENLKNDGEFKIIFHVLTGIEFKLAHQKNKFS